MTEEQPTAVHEEKEIRCPRLGGPATFSYCRIENVGKPCSRAILCWAEHFDAEDFFRKALTDDEFRECFCRPPTPKIITIMELIEKAKKLTQQSSDD